MMMMVNNNATMNNNNGGGSVNGAGNSSADGSSGPQLRQNLLSFDSILNPEGNNIDDDDDDNNGKPRAGGAPLTPTNNNNNNNGGSASSMVDFTAPLSVALSATLEDPANVQRTSSPPHSNFFSRRRLDPSDRRWAANDASEILATPISVMPPPKSSQWEHWPGKIQADQPKQRSMLDSLSPFSPRRRLEAE